MLRDGPVDLGEGRGVGVEEFVKKIIAEPQKGIKINLHTQHFEKKSAKQKIKVYIDPILTPSPPHTHSPSEKILL